MLFSSGSSQYISLPATMMTSSQTNQIGVTYATWIWLNGSTDMGIMGQSIDGTYTWYSNGGIYIGNDWKVHAVSCCKDQGESCVGTNCADSVTSSAIDDSNWYHLAAVFDPANNKQYLYINGGLADEDDIVALANYSALTINYIGRGANASSAGYLDAWLDDVYVFDHALSALDVQGLYYYTRPTSTYEIMPSEIHIVNGTATTTIEVYPTGFINLVRE